MKKVLLAIQSSNQELYTKNTKALKAVYRKMIEEFDLSEITVDVISFTAGEKTEFIGNTLYTQCLDSDEYLKHRIFCEYLLQHPEYDYIIKTNATTLVNLSYINAFIKEGLWLDNVFYGTHLVEFERQYLYLSGNVIMSTGKNFREKLCNLEAYDKLFVEHKEQLEEVFGTPNNDSHKWQGVPEDLIWGLMLYKYENVYLFALSDSMILQGLWTEWFEQNEETILERVSKRNIYVYVKLHEQPHELRAKIEPLLITALGQIMLQAPIEEVGRYEYRYILINEK